MSVRTLLYVKMLPVQPYHEGSYPPGAKFPQFGDDVIGGYLNAHAALAEKRRNMVPFHIGRLQQDGLVPLNHMETQTPAPRPDPHQALAWAPLSDCDSDLLCPASCMPLRIPCVLAHPGFFHTCRHTLLKTSPPTLAPPRAPSRILIWYCGSLLHTLSVAGAARSSSTGLILD